MIIQPTAACEDERQFVRHGGQEWTTLKWLAADHHNWLEEEAPRLLGIGTEPEFATGRRALLLQSDGGNLLWDCITLLDGQTAAELSARGGIRAIRSRIRIITRRWWIGRSDSMRKYFCTLPIASG